MHRVDVNRQAPVLAAAQAIIRAPAERVWHLLATFESWPEWNPQVTNIQLHGPAAPGTRFRWVAGGSRISSRIEAFEPPRRLAWSGTTAGIRAMHVWTFEALPAGTRVRSEESFEGLLPRWFPTRMRRLLEKSLQQGLAALKDTAEARVQVPAKRSPRA